MRSKKRRKQNWLIFLISILVVLFIVSYIKYNDEIKSWFIKEETNIKDNDEKEVNNKDTDEEEKIDPYKEYKAISYYKLDNLNRYVAYKNKYPSYSYEQIVTYVNIGLDYEFYDYISDANMDDGILVLMNKYYKLPDNYLPNDLETISSEYFINGNSKVRMLRKEAKEAFEMMSQAAIDNGTPVYGQSGFRPYDMQSSLYNNAVSSMGKKSADNDTARPGHSEHQTGLAIDVSSTKGGNMLSFENTESFTWMQTNAYRYGFILRYPNEKTNLTGFMYESWHYRYVGVKVATDIHDNYSNLTYEEYYVKFLDK